MKKLSIDNPFFDFMGRIGDIIILNILFLITSIPVVTIGMSMTALYRVILRIIRKESCYVFREYFMACKEEWKKASILWMMFLLTGILLIFDISYARNLPVILSVALGCVIAIWYAVFCYAFWLQARYENQIKDTLKNALILAVTYLPYTVIMAVLNAIPAVCIAMGAFATAAAMPLYVVIGFGLTARINGIFINRIFQKMFAGGNDHED